MRRTPGFRNKGIGDVIGDIPLGTTLNILGGPNQVDDLTWWEVTGKDGQGATVRGWMAEALPDGTRLLDISNVGVPTGGEPPAATSTPGQFALGDKLHTLDIVRLRRTPGFNNKPATDVVADVAKDVTATVIGGPIQADGLTWWQVNSTAPTGGAVSGWMAESVSGKALLAKGAADDASRGETGKFSAGQQLRTLDIVRMRKTPGFFGKLTSDIVWDVPKDRTLKVLGGPQKADGLTWWNVEVKNDQGQTLKGWMAESLANGILLLEITSGSTAGGSGPTTPTPTTGNARFAAGNSFKTVDIVRMRRTPGYFDKPSTDIVADIPTGTAGKILGGPQSEDDLIWWNVETTGFAGQKLTGWMAQDGPNGIALIQKVDGSTTPPPPVKTGAFETGELVVTADAVNVRKTAGYLNKPGDDVLGEHLHRFLFGDAAVQVVADLGQEVGSQLDPGHHRNAITDVQGPTTFGAEEQPLPVFLGECRGLGLTLLVGHTVSFGVSPNQTSKSAMAPACPRGSRMASSSFSGGVSNPIQTGLSASASSSWYERHRP